MQQQFRRFLEANLQLAVPSDGSNPMQRHHQVSRPPQDLLAVPSDGSNPMQPSKPLMVSAMSGTCSTLRRVEPYATQYKDVSAAQRSTCSTIRRLETYSNTALSETFMYR